MRKHPKLQHALTVAGALIAIIALGFCEWHRLPDGHVHLAFLDIGQGDSELITTPSGKHVLVDGGPDLTALQRLGEQMSFFDRRIDLLVLTHPHLDHVASFPEILKRYDVHAILLSGAAYDLPRYRALLAGIQEQHLRVVSIEPHKQIDLGDGVAMTLLWPMSSEFGWQFQKIHDSSVVFRLTYKNHSALFTGDLEANKEAELLAQHADLKSDILKVGHHGSLTSSSVDFLLAVAPALAVMSDGQGNRYGLPNPTVVGRFAKLGIPLKRTDRDGTIEITW